MKPTLRDLWRQFLPLSLSDVTMAFGDPLVTTTLAHLPFARLNLAAVGVAKSLAVFFESPIIMLLHASNALAGTAVSRRLLKRFMIVICGLLTLLLGTLTLRSVFTPFGTRLLGVTPEILETARRVLLMMVVWPFAIGWRRYFQGLLIHSGHSRAVARGGLGRIAIVAVTLALGFWGQLHGALLAPLALITGVIAEAVIVTVAAKTLGATQAPPIESSPQLPSSMRGIWSFYWPLASSMLVVWGGRALLVGVVARAQDGALALAAWPAAWGLVLVIANATRMVQQVVIKNRELAETKLLLTFAMTVGLACSALLFFIGLSPVGATVIAGFVGGDAALIQSIRPVVQVCAIIPIIIAMQNALQGFLISESRTHRINVATWLGTAVLLSAAYIFLRAGWSGAMAAALAMLVALVVETGWLALGLIRTKSSMRAKSSARTKALADLQTRKAL